MMTFVPAQKVRGLRFMVYTEEATAGLWRIRRTLQQLGVNPFTNQFAQPLKIVYLT